MKELQEILGTLGARFKISDTQARAMATQIEAINLVSGRVEDRKSDIEELKKKIIQTYRPSNGDTFLEVEGFDGFNSLQFFYHTGELLQKSFTPSLDILLRLRNASRRLPHQLEVKDMHPQDAIATIKTLEETLGATLDVIVKGTLRYGESVKAVYRRTRDQFRYLQKRFLNMGIEENRAYRDPTENNDQTGFDFARVPYIKTELVRNNALLTDLLLDIADQLPRQHTRKEKVKGKRKPKEVKFFDNFDIDRAARILIELSDPAYQAYVENPHGFLKQVSDSIISYYEIMSSLEPHLKRIAEEFSRDPSTTFVLNNEALQRTMPNPASMVSRITGINYLGIRPQEEEVRPISQLERRHFAARKALLEHIATAITEISHKDSYGHKFQIAKLAVERGAQLRQKVREALETKQSVKLGRDKRDDNEFYVGITKGFGEFGFEREAAPTVKLKDVYGRSFGAMKEHLEDLASYSKFLHLFSATAPRGKIKSNIIAIGPYGCGKTEIGRAIAGDPRFIGAEVSVTDLLTCWFGEFEKNIDRVWDAARELRRNSGDSKLVFLLMDEFDSWFNSSNGFWVDSTYQRAQKALQMKLDGVVDYEGIITVGFTNEPAKIPLAIYRRFKYVDIVGELEPQERVDLLKKFLTNGLPLSSGFREHDYQRWAAMLENATGDIIGKVVDDLHYDYMRKFISEHPKEGRKLNGYIARHTRKNSDELDKAYIRRTMGQYLRVTPEMLDEKMTAKLSEPIIREQIDTAKRVYAEAKQVLANLHRRKDAASGCYRQPKAESPIIVPPNIAIQ